MGSAQFMQKGIEKIKEATEIDMRVTQSGSMRYDGAVASYITGIEYFNQALKCMSSTPSLPLSRYGKILLLSLTRICRGLCCTAVCMQLYHTRARRRD